MGAVILDTLAEGHAPKGDPPEDLRDACEAAAVAVMERADAGQVDGLGVIAYEAAQRRMVERGDGGIPAPWRTLDVSVRRGWTTAAQRVASESEMARAMRAMKTEMAATAPGAFARTLEVPMSDSIAKIDDEGALEGEVVQNLSTLRESWTRYILRVTDCELAPIDDKRRLILAAASQIGHWFGLGTADFEHFNRNVSVTLPPIPGLWSKPLILLAEDVVEDDITATEVISHEADHGRALRLKYPDASIWPAEVNYVALYATSKDARASCEADPYFSGRYVRAMLDGRPIDPSTIASSMHSIYMLSDGALDLGVDIVASHMDSVAENGGRPPLWMAREFATWADDRFPSLIHRPWEAAR